MTTMSRAGAVLASLMAASALTPALAADMTPERALNAGAVFRAPPISFAINGKQYIAVLAGARQNPAEIVDYPELKNQSTASMLYVFGL